MKRIFWLSLLLFTAWSLAFFVCLHLSALIGIRLPTSLIDGGLFLFAICLVPMWIAVVFNLPRGPWPKGKNWLDAIFAEFPQPQLAEKVFKYLWYYFILFFGLAIALPDSQAGWIRHLKAAGIPGIFIGFYGMGFLCAWANWKKANREHPSKRSG